MRDRSRSLVLVAAGLLLAACGDDSGDGDGMDMATGGTGAPITAAAPAPPPTGTMDAGPLPTGTPTAGAAASPAPTTGGAPPPPPPPTGGTGGMMTAGMDAPVPECFLEVAIECDGDEDCPGSQVCCGDYDSGGSTYTGVSCQDSCAADGAHYKLCHDTSECTAIDAAYECRRSQVFPHDFVSVCADPASVPTDSTGEDVADSIRCGDTECTGGDRCCLTSFREGNSLGDPTSMVEAFCVPAGGTCECGGGAAIPDAGIDASADNDAG